MQTKTLFSQHYLDTRLPQHAEWVEDPAPVYAARRALWDKAQQFGATWSEAQTEDEFISKRRLAAADRLIDLSVYRLYELTAEEVGIVEGK